MSHVHWTGRVEGLLQSVPLAAARRATNAAGSGVVEPGAEAPLLLGIAVEHDPRHARLGEVGQELDPRAALATRFTALAATTRAAIVTSGRVR